jgi:energy-coupling factor transporter ATP-binding protein EcfA2
MCRRDEASGESRVTPLPGEKNELHYIPLGVGIVIPPWNFPLAILVGMTLASVVAGNTVVLKPSSDSPTIAYKFFAVLEEAGLVELDSTRPVRGFSGGERQRLGIAQAQVNYPDLLILDEPTSVLTPQEAGELIVLLKKMAGSGTPIVLISHKLNEVMAVSDRVTVLRDGEVVATVKTSETSPDELAVKMVGRELVCCARGAESSAGRTVLELKDVWVSGGLLPAPEYESVAAFGPMQLVDDLTAILKSNDLCNRYGLDTISTGATIAFAMECYEKGLINKNDTYIRKCCLDKIKTC